MKRPLPSRAAMTLLEVLIVSGIVAVAAGLLLPAVQKVREASARTRCVNHLRQIGGACHGYHDARGRFPAGGTAAPDPHAADPARRDETWTWAYHLLPFLEQPALHRDPDPAAVRRTPVPVFYCPARRPPTAYPTGAKTDYAGNAGTGPDADDGVIVRADRGPVRLFDIPDGAGATVLVGEKRLNDAALGESADDDDPYPAAAWAGDYEVYRTAADPPAADDRDPGASGLRPRRNFGSAHPGVFDAAFCDGSVRTVRFGLTPDTWRRACSRNDRVVPAPNDP